jgi:DNA polymerase III subunit gamma/tau
MTQQLSLSARPKNLHSLVGQKKLVEQIRGMMASGRMVKSWLLVGSTGTGKTTLARILALSLVCEHQAIFGSPCKECWANRNSFDIYEINASKITGIRELEAALDGADLYPRFGKYRIYVLDEVHRTSAAAQSLILKYLEDDTPDSTIFILATTDPHMLSDTIQSRCGAGTFRLKELDYDDITLLVTRLLKKVGSDRPADRLVDELVENQIRYPRTIVQTVEKYVSGMDAKDAIDVVGAGDVDTKALNRALVKGDWKGVARYLLDAQPNDMRAIRIACIRYLRKILLTSPEISDRTKSVADAVALLCSLQNTEGVVMAGGTAAALYGITARMEQYKR